MGEFLARRCEDDELEDKKDEEVLGVTFMTIGGRLAEAWPMSRSEVTRDLERPILTTVPRVAGVISVDLMTRIRRPSQKEFLSNTVCHDPRKGFLPSSGRLLYVDRAVVRREYRICK